MSNALRYPSLDHLPAHLRQAAEAALAKQGGPKVLGVDTAADGTSTAVSGVVLPGGTVVVTGLDTMKPAAKRRHKYAAQAVVIDGIRFDSKREGRLYESLKARVAAGEVAFFLRQVPIHLPGGTKLVVDFLVFFTDGRPPEFLDAKGLETPLFKVKRREVEAAYPIRIVTV